MSPRPALIRLTERSALWQWSENELVSLAEGAALLFPHGPFSTASLRNASKKGDLAVISVGGKIFTTIGNLRRMSTPHTTERPQSRQEDAILKTERMIEERVAERINKGFTTRKIHRR